LGRERDAYLAALSVSLLFVTSASTVGDARSEYDALVLKGEAAFGG